MFVNRENKHIVQAVCWRFEGAQDPVWITKALASGHIVIEFGADGVGYDARLMLKIDGKKAYAYPGAWVVKTLGGEFSFHSPQNFENQFEPYLTGSTQKEKSNPGRGARVSS